VVALDRAEPALLDDYRTDDSVKDGQTN